MAFGTGRSSRRGALARAARAVVVACAATVAAGAGEPLTQAEADALARAIEVAKSADAAGGRACAEELERLAARLGDGDPRAAEALAYAAVCHEAAGEFAAMVAARERLVDRFPDAPAARLALLALARHHRATAAFERAAAAMELFAERWPDELEAVDVLHEAALLRAQLGEDARALALLERVEARVAAKDPQRAAALFWARADLLPGTLPDDQARRAHAEAYLLRHGRGGGPARRIVAEVTIAAIHWRQACKHGGGPLDLCVAMKPLASDPPKGAAPKGAAAKGKPKPTCAGPSTQVVTVSPRDRGLVELAQRRLRDIVKLGQVLPPVDDPWLQARVDEALDVAELILADGEVEELLALRVPTGLDFHVDDWRASSSKPGDLKLYQEQVRRREDSQRRFTAYWEQASGRSGELSRRLQSIRRSPRGLLAVAARTALLASVQVDSLRAAEVPKLRSAAEVQAYCGALGEVSGPIEQSAMAALQYCLERAARFGYTDASVEFCQAALERRDPRRFPPQAELFGPVQPTPAPWSAPAQLEPPVEAD